MLWVSGWLQVTEVLHPAFWISTLYRPWVKHIMGTDKINSGVTRQHLRLPGMECPPAQRPAWSIVPWCWRATELTLQSASLGHSLEITSNGRQNNYMNLGLDGIPQRCRWSAYQAMILVSIAKTSSTKSTRRLKLSNDITIHMMKQSDYTNNLECCRVLWTSSKLDNIYNWQVL